MDYGIDCVSSEDFDKTKDTYVDGSKTPAHGDQRVWIKPSDALFDDQIKEEILECEFQTTSVKDEIEEIEEDNIEEEQITIGPALGRDLVGPPPSIKLPKVAIPKLRKTVTKRKVKKPKGRMGRKPRPILPMTRPVASTSHVDQPSTAPHQILMPSSQMPGIAYQFFLGDQNKNSNNPVQYTMLQPQPVFLQQTPTSVSTPSPVVLSQPYQMGQAQIRPPPKNAKIPPKIAPKAFPQSFCTFCYKYVNNLREHLKECALNPNGKNYKFRKIAPSTFQ